MIARTRPTATPDSLQDSLPGRHSPYIDQYVVPVGIGRHSAAMEGSYFTALNATLATAITGHAAPAIADVATKPIIHIYNGGDKYICLDFIKMALNTVNASSTSTDFVVYTNNAQSRASGGTAITPASVRSDAPFTSGATIYAGAVVAAPASARKIAQWTVRPVIGVTEDQYYFSFGDGIKPFSSVITGTTVNAIPVSFPPVVITPGCELLFVQIGPSGASTAQTFEFELGYIER